MVECEGRGHRPVRMGGAVSDESLAEIRRSVTNISTALALHDQKVDANVVRIAESQERLVQAVERIGDATIAIQTLAQHLEVRLNGKNGKGSPILADGKKLVGLGLVILLVSSFVAGGGAELMRALLEAVKK